MNTLEQSVFRMYTDVKLGVNPTCLQCRAGEDSKGRPISRPASFWHIGDKFEEDASRVLFVVKNTMNCSDFKVRNGVLNASRESARLFFAGESDLWTAISTIYRRVADVDEDELLSRIAVTNMVKCNHFQSREDPRSIKDTASEGMKRNCADHLGVLWNEMTLLRPRHVIFFTHWDYDSQIARFSCGNGVVERTSSKDSLLLQGQKQRVAWWSRDFYQDRRLALRTLRTSTPERKIGEFAEVVADWLQAASHINWSVTDWTARTNDVTGPGKTMISEK